MSRNSLLPFTSTRCTASATLSSLSDPHDASGFQKAACGKKEKKIRLSILASCSQEFCRHIIKAPGLDCQSLKWWTFQFKRHHLSPVCNTPWAQNSSMLMWQLLLYFSVWHINNHIEIFQWSHKSCIWAI